MLQPYSYTSGATIFLSAIVALSLVAIGAGAIVAPRMFAMQYGIELDDPRALGFLRAMGVRDLAIGVLFVESAKSAGSAGRKGGGSDGPAKMTAFIGIGRRPAAPAGRAYNADV